MALIQSGSKSARIMLVGEAPGAQEVEKGEAFVGASGKELNRMLGEAGLERKQIFVTNVCHFQPPDNKIEKFFYNKTEAKKEGINEIGGRRPNQYILDGLAQLRRDIEEVQPDIIVPAGNVALWAICGEWGITSWRGSLLDYSPLLVHEHGALKRNPLIIPSYHPAAILRQWSWRSIFIHDMKYVKKNLHEPVKQPNWQFTIRPSMRDFMEATAGLLETLNNAKEPLTVAGDIETRNGHIACIGIATSRLHAFCIPLMCTERPAGYWLAGEEEYVWKKLREIFQHPNIRIIWQNGLYDCQYFWRTFGWLPKVWDDTMLMQHSCFPELPKSLGFLASMYCEYRKFWKEDGKNWDESVGEDQLWTYNCTDCVRTLEIYERLNPVVDQMGVRDIHRATLFLYEPVLDMMLRGVKIDKLKRENLSVELLTAYEQRVKWLESVVGYAINPRSPKQISDMFFRDLGVKPVRRTDSGNWSTDKETLDKIKERDILYEPIVDRILEMRSIGVYRSTFVEAGIDRDGRIRCSYNLAGTITSRFSSSENAFGTGTNLENIPRPGEVKGTMRMPDIRGLFIPDEAYCIGDADLERADAQVVAWDADAKALKQMLKEGADIHEENSKVIKMSRQIAKTFVHATNYCCTAKTAAARCGITTHEADRAQRRWFGAHPEIKQWHDRIWFDLQTKRRTLTQFGRRRDYFGRIDRGLLDDAVAWIGQTTVAEVTNRGLRQVYDGGREGLLRDVKLQLQLQNHDSLVFQFLYDDKWEEVLKEVRRHMEVVVPYEDPLVIPVGFKISQESWGKCKEIEV